MKPHRAIEILELHMAERTDFDDSGVIDENVDLGEVLESLLNSGLNLRRFQQIALNREDFSRETLQFIFSVLKFFCIAREEGDFPAAGANFSRDLKAETARAAGNKGDFVFVK